jgi:hypothetical protein
LHAHEATAALDGAPLDAGPLGSTGGGGEPPGADGPTMTVAAQALWSAQVKSAADLPVVARSNYRMLGATCAPGASSRSRR